MLHKEGQIAPPKASDLDCVQEMATTCVDCRICVQECSFLQEYGSPKELALSWQQGEKEKCPPFECSLCGLCYAVCPKKLDPSAMFLEMRRELVTAGRGTFPQHRTIRSYEKKGHSSFFSWFHLPKNCSTILFPGCAFPGSRPETLLGLYQFLCKTDPQLGMVFDCCGKPSHDLGAEAYFQKMFAQLLQILHSQKVKKVLVTCPNCYRIFAEYGEGLQVESVYEALLHSMEGLSQMQKTVTVHDPCGVRFSDSVQRSVRTILQNLGSSVTEMEHSGRSSFCCGEGGAAGFIRPDFARSWTKKRVAEAGNKQVVTYCAGCTNFLAKEIKTDHILDLLFAPVLGGKQQVKVSKAPFTYLNRYRLRRSLQKQICDGVSGTLKQLSSSLLSISEKV